MNDYRSRDWTGLRLEVDGHTAVVTLDNPPAHTWTVHSLAALREMQAAGVRMRVGRRLNSGASSPGRR